jgi:hypothetical protein
MRKLTYLIRRINIAAASDRHFVRSYNRSMDIDTMQGPSPVPFYRMLFSPRMLKMPGFSHVFVSRPHLFVRSFLRGIQL